MNMLAQAAIFFAAAIIVVPIFKRLGLSAVLGYLVAGVAIGPWGLGFISDVGAILHFAEFGVVLLLFIIGLELQPARLWTMRSAVFGLGGAQVALTAVVLGSGALLGGIDLGGAAIIGLGLALSSTALVLQSLAERGELGARHGRAAFAILLFQDLAAIPTLAIVPLLSGTTSGEDSLIVAFLRVAGVLGAVVIGGHFLLRPVLRAVAGTRIPELFTATALLIVSGTALLMNWVGISMALGAFMAGMLLADSEYRHELEADIEPFKGLLLGLFFISVGMGLNLGLVAEEPVVVVALVLALLSVKALIIYGAGRLWGLSKMSAKDLGLALPQGGEFAFVIFAAAAAAGVMAPSLTELLVLVVSLSMAATPFIGLANDAVIHRLRTAPEREFDTMPEEQSTVIIAGFGRFGQIVGRVLAARKIRFTALDASPEQVDFVKNYGNEVYYGDASRLDLLRAAKADTAKVFVLAVDDVEASLRTAETVVKHFPRLKVFARARNRQHAYRLMDLGVTLIQRETFLSSLEMARDVLQGLGMNRSEAERTVRTFQAHDEKRLFEHYNHYNDSEKMRGLAKAGARELEEMFARDAAESVALEVKN